MYVFMEKEGKLSLNFPCNPSYVKYCISQGIIKSLRTYILVNCANMFC